jgi:hypothetical protein
MSGVDQANDFPHGFSIRNNMLEMQTGRDYSDSVEGICCCQCRDEPRMVEPVVFLSMIGYGIIRIQTLNCSSPFVVREISGTQLRNAISARSNFGLGYIQITMGLSPRVLMYTDLAIDLVGVSRLGNGYRTDGVAKRTNSRDPCNRRPGQRLAWPRGHRLLS